MHTFKGKVTWIDIVGPTKVDAAFLKKQYNIHPVILDELLHTSARSRVERYDDYLYLTYHLPLYETGERTSRQGEIDFLIMKDTVVTVRYEGLEPIDAMIGLIETDSALREKMLEKNTALLTYHLIESTIAYSLRQLRHIEEHIRSISREIFKGRERKLLEQISYVKRDLLDYHLIARPKKILLQSLLETAVEFWGPQVKVYFNDLIGDDLKVQQHIENYLEITESLEATNSQLLNAKMNRVMQQFNVLAFFTFPAILFISIHSVQSLTANFWIGLGVVFAATALILLFFRYRDVI